MRAERRFEEGDVCRGVVSGVAKFGIFLDLGDRTGFVSIAEISWDRFTDVAEVVRVGQELNAVVIGEDPVRGQLLLSLKGLLEDPMRAFARLHFGEVFSGGVTKVTPIGAFVSLAGDLEGLVPQKDLAGRGRDFQVGDEVTVAITGINVENRRITLSLAE
ncbi:S1 RNA-binding domain-containing protein [Streptomyces exfoliatus]|uniref:S1 RNA-binding domain-containing protein n=1 Tax=Streptomyces exfoliatus TaxID=1905 RepID=UPI003C2BD3C9